MSEQYHAKNHAVFRLTYHVIFVTKYRKPVISEAIGDYMKQIARRQIEIVGGELLSAETDRDHIHLLISTIPDCNISNVINVLKTQLSKEVRKVPEYAAFIKQYQFGDCPLWSPSYFIATTGSVSLETVKSYIEGQRTDEHKRKYEKTGRRSKKKKTSKRS